MNATARLKQIRQLCRDAKELEGLEIRTPANHLGGCALMPGATAELRGYVAALKEVQKLCRPQRRRKRRKS